MDDFFLENKVRKIVFNYFVYFTKSIFTLLFICFFSLIMVSDLVYSVEIDDSWNISEGLIYNMNSNIWPVYVYGDCPNFEIMINNVSKSMTTLFRFTDIKNSHIGLPSQRTLERALCIATNGVGDVDFVVDSDIVDYLEVSMIRPGNSHINMHSEGVSIPVYLDGSEAFSHVLVTSIGPEPPSTNYSCIGSLNGNSAKGYHYGDCVHNPVNRIWVSLEEDFKVWLEAPNGVTGEESVQIEANCYGNSIVCNESSLKLYHSPLLTEKCPLDEKLYTFDNNNNFTDDGWVCAIGFSNTGRYAVSNPLQILVEDFWIISEYGLNLRTDSLSTRISIETNEPGYCELSYDDSIYGPFVSDISQLGFKRYSKFHETIIQLSEEDYGLKKSVRILCEDENGLNTATKNFTVELTDLMVEMYIDDLDDGKLTVFEGQSKLYDMRIESSGSPVYGLKSNQFDTVISSIAGDIYLGISAVVTNQLNFSLSLDAQLNPGDYNLTIDCVNGIECDSTSWDLEVLDSGLTVLMSEPLVASSNDGYSSENGDSIAYLTGEDLYYDEVAGSVSATEGVSLFVTDSNTRIDNILESEGELPTYLIVSDENIKWIVDEYQTTGARILLRYIGRDIDGNRIIKVEYI